MDLLGVASRIMNAQIFYGNATAGLQVAIPLVKEQHATSCKQGYGGPRCYRMQKSTPRRVVMSARELGDHRVGTRCQYT